MRHYHNFYPKQLFFPIYEEEIVFSICKVLRLFKNIFISKNILL